jgi:small subunit ribosomal protein S2
MVDTNADPELVDFAIPSNDDASKSITIILDSLNLGVKEGLADRKKEKEVQAAAKKDEEATKEAVKAEKEAAKAAAKVEKTVAKAEKVEVKEVKAE